MGMSNKAPYLSLGYRDKVVEHSTSIRRVKDGCIQVCVQRERREYDSNFINEKRFKSIR